MQNSINYPGSEIRLAQALPQPPKSLCSELVARLQANQQKRAINRLNAMELIANGKGDKLMACNMEFHWLMEEAEQLETAIAAVDAPVTDKLLDDVTLPMTREQEANRAGADAMIDRDASYGGNE